MELAIILILIISFGKHIMTEVPDKFNGDFNHYKPCKSCSQTLDILKNSSELSSKGFGTNSHFQTSKFHSRKP